MTLFRSKMGLTLLKSQEKKKERKYDELAKDFISKRLSAKVEAIIVGSLGSWDHDNDRIIKRLCSTSYLKMMRKIMISETISYSRDIYDEHLRRTRQDSSGRQR